MSSPSVAVQGLSKRFGQTLALSGVTFDVGVGEVFGLLGPNGAGKTTLIRILLGLVSPDAGSVTVLGHAGPARFPDVARRVGVVMSPPTMYPHLSALDNLRVAAYTAGHHPPKHSLEALLGRVGLDNTSNRRVKGFSTGMRQRLGLAAALLTPPELLVLDEPTSGLDPLGVRDIRDVLRELAEAGCAILLASHQLREIELLCERVALIHLGRVARWGRLQDLLPKARTLALRVASPERAVAALTRAGIGSSLDGGRVIAEDADPEEVVRALSRARIYPEEMTPATPALEQLFIGAVDGRL